MKDNYGVKKLMDQKNFYRIVKKICRLFRNNLLRKENNGEFKLWMKEKIILKELMHYYKKMAKKKEK